jgi:hydrogenase/urease accessory protein HupE
MKRLGLALAVSAALASPARAHPLPFSSLDLRIEPGAIELSLTAHAFDLAHDLGVEPAELPRRGSAIAALFAPRLKLTVDGQPLAVRWAPSQTTGDSQRLVWRQPLTRAPSVIHLEATLFPYDANHQTFVNVYEQGSLTAQAIIDARHPALDHYAGTAAGRLAVARKFGGEGIHHILIGFDHLLFLVGLLLLGGSLRQLVVVASAFTLGHSVTLSLAALNVVNVPARIIEPAIALSIVFVGADNLLARPGGRDLRPWIALAFGLIHGFGFAGVLRETGLPSGALGWSLFSFNVGVEIGQLAVVVAVTAALAALRARSERAGRRLTFVGSVVVAAAGAFWFIERIIFPGGI